MITDILLKESLNDLLLSSNETSNKKLSIHEFVDLFKKKFKYVNTVETLAGIRPLGKGSYGIIFKTQTDNEYVIKFFRRSFNNPELYYIKDFINKDVPHIVKVYSFIDNISLIEEYQYAVVMEKLEEIEGKYDFSYLQLITQTCREMNILFKKEPRFRKFNDIFDPDEIKQFITDFLSKPSDITYPNRWKSIWEMILESKDKTKFFTEVTVGMNYYLKMSGRFYIDLHTNNVMYDTKSNEYKLVDII